MERFVRSRPVRVCVALLFVVAGLWTFLPYLAFRVAPSAFVNSEINRVTAPFSGQLQAALPAKGKFVAELTTLNLLELRAPDRRQVVTLEQQLGTANSRASLIEAQLREIQDADRLLAARTEIHRKGMLIRLAREIEESEAKRNGCLAEEIERRKSRVRVDQLAPTGAVSLSHIDEAESTHRSTAARCQAASAHTLRLRAEAEAAQQGIFLQDGYNDAPYSQQQRDRLMLRRQELEADLLRESARSDQLSRELKEEQARLRRSSRYDLALEPGQMIWSLLASPGSAVVEGQPVMDIANCRKRFVVVELPERDMELVHAGDSARIRLVGSDTWITGTIHQVRGSAARQDERLLAAQVARPSDRSLTVEVSFPDSMGPTEANRFCDIGRLAEVWFERRTFNFTDAILQTFRRLSESLSVPTSQSASRLTIHGP